MSVRSAPVIFGEVLFDCFPDGSQVLGGAPFNVAWHCQAFGLSPLLVSRVGRDARGEQVLSAMRDWGMDTSAVQQDDEHATGIVDVQIVDGEPHYDIVQDSAWDFIAADALPEIDADGLLYHGSLALRSADSAAALQQLKRSGREMFVDINLREPWWQVDRVRDMIRGVDCVKLNELELQALAGAASERSIAMQQLMQDRQVTRLIVTLGEQGVLAAVAGETPQQAQPQPATRVVDTVGAGDAFSSVMLLARYRGWSLADSLQRAQQFASAIVGIRGATISDSDFYQPFISTWGL